MTVSLTDPVRDPLRLAALRKVALLDTPAEEAFDRLTRLAALLTVAPVALVSLVDEDRQFFKSAVGLPEPWASRRQTPLTHSFCQHAVKTGEPLIISNAREHKWVCENLAIRDLNVIAYAGIPLVTSGGHVLGSFCVIDSDVRSWSSNDVKILTDLAASVMTEIELRTTVAREQAARAEAEEAEKKAQATAERLELIDRRRTQFLATLAHELRNPLSALSNGVTLLHMLGSENHDFQNVREMMGRQVQQLSSLVGDLMEASRIAEGKIDLSRQTIAVQDLIRESTEVVAADIKDAGHELVVECPQHRLPVEVDRQRLIQVLTNLLHNACKYTPEAGRIGVYAAEESDCVAVTVSDTGVGLNDKDVATIFDMFGQLDRSQSQRKGGIGIGLTLVKNLVELHGGEIHVSSDGEGRGSQFTVRLPKAG